jgi:hypothetical protein
MNEYRQGREDAARDVREALMASFGILYIDTCERIVAAALGE